MFAKTLTQAGHTRYFVVSAEPETGWELRVEEDSHVIRRARYTDWHRVERALSSIEREVGELQARGWRLASDSVGSVQSTNL
ncbi:MAG: hypothetical protein H0W08_18070 [Acidobacteria bacterium]|nr:hypothetical protein [Acidobacteriota bacterium]